MSPITSHPPAGPGTLPLEKIALLLGDVARLRILSELSKGEPLMVIELAQRIDRTPTNTSKHLATLLRAGAVTKVRRLYSVPAHFRPLPGERVLDFGHAVLRLGEPA